MLLYHTIFRHAQIIRKLLCQKPVAQINKFPSANCVHLVGFSSHGIAHRRNTSLKSCRIIQMQLSLCLSLNHLDPSRINKQYMCSLIGGELQRNSEDLGFFPFSRTLNNLVDVTSCPCASATVLKLPR